MNSQQLNRVLLDVSLPFRVFESVDESLLVADASGLPFLFDQLIALNVGLAVCSPIHPASAARRALPATAQQRVRQHRGRDQAGNRAKAILTPVATELGYTLFDEPGVVLRPNGLFAALGSSLAEHDGSPETDAQHLAALYLWLTRFLHGASAKATVNLKIDKVRSTIESLLRSCATAQARSHLAHLEGLFGRYEAIETAGLVIIPQTVSENAGEMFVRFVEDASYEQLCLQTFRLGLPGRSRRGIAALERATARVARSRVALGVAQLAVRVLCLFKGLPADDLPQLRPLGTYIPPIADLSPHIQRAHSEWLRIQPKFVPVAPGDQPRDRAKWTEWQGRWSDLGAVGTIQIKKLQGSSPD